MKYGSLLAPFLLVQCSIYDVDRFLSFCQYEITNKEDYTMKKIIASIVIALSLSACGTLRELNKPEVSADGSREFRATAAIGRCRC